MNGLEKILKLFKEKPYLVGMGAGKISKRYNISIEDIMKARKVLQKEKNKKREAKILIFDIETSPLRAYVWSRWKQNIFLEQTISEWFMISWSAKWLNSSEVLSECLTPEEIVKENDDRIVKDLWSLIDQADIVVAHNGKNFDVPKMNARFILAGLPPTSPYIQIDTKEVAAKQFRFSSNKLDALAGYFNIDHKDDTDFELWVRCLNGEQEALDYMEKYNRNDVLILEKVYLKLRPWIKNHPNIGLYLEEDNMVCPTCGSKHLSEDNSFHYTSVNKYKVMRCDDCGAISRLRTTAYPKDKRNNLITSV